MKPIKFPPFLYLFLVLVLTGIACGGMSVTSTPTPAATATDAPPEATATKTPRPTSTPRPSPTPNAAATQKTEDFNVLLSEYKEKGYVTTTTGEFFEPDPFQEDWAQLGWYQWWPFDFKAKDFVFSAHFDWSLASATPEISGCGVIFGLQENDDHYAVFLDTSRILFLMGRGSNVYNVGKTRGPGTVNFSNPAEADFVLSVKGQSAYVSVNDVVTEYTLSADQTSAGTFAFSILSGTNKDYGTRCGMTDMIFWEPK